MKSLTDFTQVDILDCSLRDGGYYTAWDFDEVMVRTYLESMARLPVATVELGYLNSCRAGYFGEYYYLTPVRTAWAKSLLRPDQQLAVMFDEKSVSAGAAADLLAGHQESVDVVRIAVAPTRLREGAALLRAIADAGFMTGGNIMYLSQYWGDVLQLEGLADFIDACNCVSLVDSYGACTPAQVSGAIESLTTRFPMASVGFHGHDNLGLAFANSLAAAERGADVVDGTMSGIGRGPGNTKTEALLAYQASLATSEFNFFALERGLRPFLDAQAQYGWGTNLAYMISGAAGLPQNDVMDWLGKHRYSATAIIQALQGQGDEQLDHEIYEKPQDAGLFTEAVIVGGGKSVREHSVAIAEHIERTNAVVIHGNYQNLDLSNRLGGRQYLCLAGDAVDRLPRKENLSPGTSIVVPSAPRFRGSVPDDSEVWQVEPFKSSNEALGPVSDTAPLALAMGLALQLGVRKLTLVGFDGYEFASTAEQELAREIQEMLDRFARANPDVKLISATRTLYSIDTVSVYGLLADR